MFASTGISSSNGDGNTKAHAAGVANRTSLVQTGFDPALLILVGGMLLTAGTVLLARARRAQS